MMIVVEKSVVWWLKMTHVLTRVFKLWIPGVIIIYQEASGKPTQKGVTTSKLFSTRQWRHVKKLIVLRIWTKKQKHVPLIWHITCLFCFYIRQVQSACDTFIIYDQKYSLKICHALISFSTIILDYTDGGDRLQHFFFCVLNICFDMNVLLFVHSFRETNMFL